MVYLPKHTKRMAELTKAQSELWSVIDTFVSQLEDEGYLFDDLTKMLKEYGEIMEDLSAK